MSSDVTKLESSIHRKFTKPLNLKSFQNDLPDHEAMLNKTAIGKSITLGEPPPVLLSEHDQAPAYVPSDNIIQMISLMSNPPTFNECVAVDNAKIEDRKYQLETFKELKKSHIKLGLELEDIHELLFEALEKEKEIKKKIISEKGYEAYKTNFIINKRNPHLLWKWIKQYAQQSIRNIVQGLDIDWLNVILRNDLFKWWLDVRRVLQGFEDINMPLDDVRKCNKVYNSLTRNSMDQSCLQTSDEIVSAFQTLYSVCIGINQTNCFF